MSRKNPKLALLAKIDGVKKSSGIFFAEIKKNKNIQLSAFAKRRATCFYFFEFLQKTHHF